MTASPSRLSRQVVLGLLVVVLLGAFALRVWDLNAPSIWHDEAWSIRAVRDPIRTPDDKTPFLYYGVVHLLWMGAGDTPLALRYGSVLLDLITVALATFVMQRWMGRDAALLAAVLFALSPLLWAYAREVRAYVGVALLTVLLLDLAERVLAARGRLPGRVWGALLLAELALLYTHNLSVPVVGWLNITLAAVWIGRREWHTLMAWCAGQALLLLAYVPWLLRQAPSGTPLNTPPAINARLVWDIWQSLFAPVPAQLGREHALVIASAVFGAAALLCVVIVARYRHDRRAFLVLSQLGLLPALLVIELHVAHIDFHPRYVIPVLPAALLIVVMGVESLPRGWNARVLAIPGVVALACAVAAASFPDLFTKPEYQHDDFRAIAEYYATLPADAIIIIPYGWEPALDVYYAEKAGIQAEMVGIDLHSDADTAAAVLNAALAKRAGPARVELLTWYQLPADWRGMYPCLLESAGQPAGVFTVYGLSTQGYTLGSSVGWREVIAPDADYGAVTLDSSVRLGGIDAVCVNTTWTLQRAAKTDWRVAARLLTVEPAGWEIARSDADIRSVEQAPTSVLDVSDQAEAFNLLRFPSGAPPGEYVVQIGVYSAQQPDGLDRLLHGVPAGRSLPLTAVELEHPAVAARSRSPREVLALEVADGITLAGMDAPADALSPGQELRITLHWNIGADCCRDHAWEGARLILRGAAWEIGQSVQAFAPRSLDWHAFRVPPGASGEARLVLETDVEATFSLATFALAETDHLFAAPPFAIAVGAEFEQWSVLAGFSVEPVMVTPEAGLQLVLVWQARSASESSYRVFTHLLDPDNRVIAQHDGYPASGERLTTGWVPGEYVVDVHDLAFLPNGQDYRGPARLEIGLYDPDTGNRVLVSGGADHVVLPVEIMVQ